MPDYLQSVIAVHRVDTTNLQKAVNIIMPVVNSWGGEQILNTSFSGSLAKGTGVSPGTDADIFISLKSNTTNTLKEIYESLYNYLARGKFNTKIGLRKQSVSIGVDILGLSIDLVPGKKQSQHGNDHSLYKRKSDTWIKTDITKHINIVKESNRLDEIKILKIWRNINNLEFPSFFLELAVIDALTGKRYGDLAENVLTTLKYLRDNIRTKTFFDPSNTNNKISDDCNDAEKKSIVDTATLALSRQHWEQIVR